MQKAVGEIGNQWWRLRSKHGRDRLFSTPDELWLAACEYFTHTDERKWVKKDWVGKDADEVERENETPYTKTGLYLYLDVNNQYFDDFKESLKGKKDQISIDFSLIISRIEQIIYTQKFEGAAVGAFNHNIIARELGLVDKKEFEGNIKTEVQTFKINGQEISFE